MTILAGIKCLVANCGGTVAARGLCSKHYKQQQRQSALGAQEALALTFDQLWPALQTTIASIVAIKNATGVFKKGS